MQGLVKQVPAFVESVTTRNSISYRKIGLKYHRIKSTLFFGYERMQRYGSYVFVALPEKAVLDAVYFGADPDVAGVDFEMHRLKKMAKEFKVNGGWRGQKVWSWADKYAR
ncbi:MAG: hypothetical protein QXX17_06570 [Conexivisphaerales archaeon]